MSGGPAIPAADLNIFREQLIDWYQINHREFPWRSTDDPYAILVSEVMSQQTQLSRVEQAWEAFLDRWPTTADLAETDRAAVVGFWTEHRLGYNNRAKYLHRAAQQIQEEFDGTVPAEPDQLQTLSGVGPYTANAVASFAYNNGNAAVDTNVKRVIHRLTGVDDDNPDYDTLANTLLPEDQSRVWNNAMMELGAEVCQQTPRCDETPCPVRQWCTAYTTGDFTAPDVPSQPSFEGSRRQFRGRIVRALNNHDQLHIDTLGSKVRVDYAAEQADSRSWLEGIIDDLVEDGLVDRDGEIVRLKQ